MTSRRQGRRGDARARIVVLLATMASLSLLASGTALASHEGWVAQPGTTIDGGSVVLDTTDAAATPGGTSFEHPDLAVAIEPGDQISFDYVLTEGAICGGGQPRLFVEVDGSFFNTFDGTTTGDCGEFTGLGSTAGTVVVTYGGPAGTVGQAGIVFDNVSNRGVAAISNVSIGDFVLDVEDDGESGDPTAKDECKKGGWDAFGFRNQGQCIRFVNTGQDSR